LPKRSQYHDTNQKRIYPPTKANQKKTENIKKIADKGSFSNADFQNFAENLFFKNFGMSKRTRGGRKVEDRRVAYRASAS